MRTNATRYTTNEAQSNFALFSCCLPPAFPIVFPTIPDCVSRPCSPTTVCSRPISPTYSRPVLRLFPVPSHHEIVYFHPIPSTKWLPTFPPHSHPAINKREPFPIPSLGKTQNSTCGGRDGPIHYRAVPSAPRVPLIFSCYVRLTLLRVICRNKPPWRIHCIYVCMCKIYPVLFFIIYVRCLMSKVLM